MRVGAVRSAQAGGAAARRSNEEWCHAADASRRHKLQPMGRRRDMHQVADVGSGPGKMAGFAGKGREGDRNQFGVTESRDCTTSDDWDIGNRWQS